MGPSFPELDRSGGKPIRTPGWLPLGSRPPGPVHLPGTRRRGSSQSSTRGSWTDRGAVHGPIRSPITDLRALRRLENSAWPVAYRLPGSARNTGGEPGPSDPADTDNSNPATGLRFPEHPGFGWVIEESGSGGNPPETRVECWPVRHPVRSLPPDEGSRARRAPFGTPEGVSGTPESPTLNPEEPTSQGVTTHPSVAPQGAAIGPAVYRDRTRSSS